MKRGYTVEEYREMLARIRETVPERRGDQRFHRRLLRRDGSAISSRRSTWCASPDSRTASFSSTASARAPRGPSCFRTTCPKRSRGGATTNCWRCRTRSARGQPAVSGRTVEVLVEGPSKNSQTRAKTAALQLTGRTHCDRIVGFDGNRRQIGQFSRRYLRRQRVHAVRQRGDAPRGPRSVPFGNNTLPLRRARYPARARHGILSRLHPLSRTSPPKRKAGLRSWGLDDLNAATPTWSAWPRPA